MEPSQILPFVAASAVGVSMHLFVFIHGEWHLKVLHVLFGHLFAFSVVHFLCSRLNDGGITSWTLYLHIIAAYLISLFGSMSIYPAFFHRTRHFTGPKIAAVTKLWDVWQARNSENYLVMQRMYEKYGDLVRTGTMV
jgi:hypothetical protein